MKPDAVFAVTFGALAGVGTVTILQGLFRLVRDAFPRRGHRPAQPDELPTGPAPRPPGPFGTQAFPIYPRPGDPDIAPHKAPIGWLIPSRGQTGAARPVWGKASPARQSADEVKRALRDLTFLQNRAWEDLRDARRRASGVFVKGTVRRTPGGLVVETAPGIPVCRCDRPSLDIGRRARGTCLDWCTKCGLPISLWRPMPKSAHADGDPGWAESVAWTDAEQAARWGE